MECVCVCFVKVGIVFCVFRRVFGLVVHVQRLSHTDETTSRHRSAAAPSWVKLLLQRNVVAQLQTLSRKSHTGIMSRSTTVLFVLTLLSGRSLS
jgi:predicted RND superfamily exporter protein